MASSANMCVICKGGRALCGHVVCPLLSKIEFMPKVEKQMRTTEFFGPTTSVFVGHVGYPNVKMGPIGALGFKEKIDKPETWFGMSYNSIIEMRSMALRSKTNEHVKSRSRFVEENKLLAMATNAPDVEMRFKREPFYKFSFSDVTQPMGPTADLDRMKLIDNVKIPQKVDEIVKDDLRAVEQIKLLYNKFDVYYIMNVMSSGALGVQEDQRLVPTRWGITAIDDMLAKHLMEKIRDYQQIKNFMVFESQYLDNQFVILLMPGNWEYENFESWAPGSTWAQQAKEMFTIEEYEAFKGRTKYADKEGGGYYAARLGVCEGLEEMKRQARVVVFREISEGYVVPVGVWQVRENVRNAFKNIAKIFGTLDEAMEYIGPKLRVPLSTYRQQSTILKQKRLFDF
jgi:hypothetical protein